MASDVRLSADTRCLILEKAEGIPLFIEELTKLVLGADERRVGSFPIPESLSGLLASQLDRLGGGVASCRYAPWAAHFLRISHHSAVRLAR